MYEAWYGLSEKPFNLTPDPKYLYLSRLHTEAFAHLEYGRRERGGFIVITGEVGTGKTTLSRYFLSRLPPETATAVVLYPAVSAVELLQGILDDFRITGAGSTLKGQVDALHRFLLDARAKGRDVVILIDEAQDLDPEVLEQVRLISNLETDTEKLVQIVLMGQSELREILARRELRQLAQRVTARYHLAALSAAETAEYLRHRLTVAGGEGKLSFTKGALEAIHRASSGIPRLINLVADRALLGGYAQATRSIDAGLVRRAAAEVQGDTPRGVSTRTLGVAAATVVASVAIGFTLWTRTPEPAARATNVGAVAAAKVQALAPLIADFDRTASRDAALARIGALWGDEPLERTTLRTHLEQLRQLDLPAVLELFHPSRRDTCFIALLGIEGSVARVAIGTGAPVEVAISDLDRFWTREALLLWRDVHGLTRSPDRLRTEAWVRGTLGKLGYADLDSNLPEAVSRFQRDSDLLPDGLVGARTLMALYSRGSHERPHLQATPDRPGSSS